MLQINDKVKLLKDIYEEADDHSPRHYCAYKDDIVIIRALRKDGNYSVSHEHIMDNSFWVSKDEIEKVE